VFFFLFYGDFKIFLFNRHFSNIRFVDHFDQLLYLLKVHAFQFNREFKITKMEG